MYDPATNRWTGRFGHKYAYILERSGYKCQYCGRDLLAREAVGMLCIDHILPKTMKRYEHPDNLAIACVVCNKLKGKWDSTNNGANTTRESRMAAAKVHINEKKLKKSNISALYERS